MVTYDIARWTRDSFQDQLLRDHPEIVSLAPRLKRDAHGQPTAEGFILVGIRQLPNPPDGWHPLPDQFPLPARDGNDQPIAHLTVDCLVELEGPLSLGRPAPRHGEEAMRYLAAAPGGIVRPCHGGCTITHGTDTSGTLGGLVKVNGSWAAVLSCNHVLTGFQKGYVGDSIYQPVLGTSGPSTLIANLDRWVQLVPGPGNYNETDAALA